MAQTIDNQANPLTRHGEKQCIIGNPEPNYLLSLSSTFELPQNHAVSRTARVCTQRHGNGYNSGPD